MCEKSWPRNIIFPLHNGRCPKSLSPRIERVETQPYSGMNCIDTNWWPDFEACSLYGPNYGRQPNYALRGDGCLYWEFKYKGLGYKGLSLMRDDFFGPFVQNVRKFRKGTFGYEGLIDPVPSGPLYPKSAVHDRGQQWKMTYNMTTYC